MITDETPRSEQMATGHHIVTVIVLSLLTLPLSLAEADEPLIGSIAKQTLWRNRDGERRTWFHPRACMMPGTDGKPVALMTLQEIGGSDYFGQVHWSMSTDFGKTWSDPKPIAALGRDPVPGRDDDLKAAVCDVTPQYHPQTDSIIALGHVVFYKGDYFARKEQLPRYPVYVTRAKDGTWSKRKILQWDDPRGGHIYSNNCGQRVVLPNGDVQMSFTFGPMAEHRMVAGVHATFDGERLQVKEVGPPLHNPEGRGLLEPSVTEFGGKFWITMRAEDNRGYVSVSDDGLNWAEKRAWAWEDGTPIDDVHHAAALADTQRRTVPRLHTQRRLERERDSLAFATLGCTSRYRSPLPDQIDRTGRATARGRWRKRTQQSCTDGKFQCHQRQSGRILGHRRRMDAARRLPR